MSGPALRPSYEVTPNPRAEETLREFARAAAHGVRGPAGQVRTLLSLLLETLPSPPDEEVLTHLNAAVCHLGGVADALAACADVVNWPYEFAAVHSADVLASALIRFEPWLRSGDLTVEQRDLSKVRADRAQLSHVFEYLIDNSLKFRHAAPVRVVVEAREAGAEKIFSVEDNGLGIDPKYQDLLFHPFKKLWGETYAGNGIGLFLCRQIVEGHGGRIWLADPPPEGGARFEFSLPA